ncbi:MAG TPA: radical SAM family heme chaperone HemW [Terriglobales bacterium]|nr:radical SAM family heme chaperone HemW [Terriglobales bacterium]
MPLGLYLSVPFCRTKCTYCNFASDVFSRTMFQRYVDRVNFDLDHAQETALAQGGSFESAVDSIFLGGGTPTVLETDQFEALFQGIARNFHLQPGAEVTVECAPGTLTASLLEAFRRCSVNRVSLGVQSFVDKEAASVGRIHKESTVAGDIAHLRESGISNINVDLIAGLPHQTAESWEFSVQQAIASGVPHVSVYMLEVDEDSRLGREVLAGGTKYHAHFVPDDDLTADFYLAACERLNTAGIQQYEISNFARPGLESRHNLKYWTRQPYMGFGVDAHSMLKVKADAYRGVEAVRFSTPDSLDAYLRAEALQKTLLSRDAALEESFFLGLRLNRGVNLDLIRQSLGEEIVSACDSTINELVDEQLLDQTGNSLRLTSRGRLLSNEVFERFIA